MSVFIALFAFTLGFVSGYEYANAPIDGSGWWSRPGYRPVPKWLIGGWRVQIPGRGSPTIPINMIQLSGDWDYSSGIRGKAHSKATGSFHIEDSKLILEPRLFALSPEAAGGKSLIVLQINRTTNSLVFSDGTVLAKYDDTDTMYWPRE